MSFANKHNKGGVLFDIDIKDFTFRSLKELFEIDESKVVYGVDGLYINTKSKFGEHPVAINTEFGLLIDLPTYMNEEVKSILADPEDVEAIKAGKVGFHIEEFIDKTFGKNCYGIKWEDLE